MDVPEPPFAYQLFLWRHKMHVSPLEAMMTPPEIIMQDFEMLQLEAEYGTPHPQSGQNVS